MRSSWIQTQGPNPNSAFKTGSTFWPLSSKAEALAIFTSLLTIPESKKVRIFTDSQICIDTFNKLRRPHPKFSKKRLLKIKNWSIWTKIIEMVQSKDLTVELIKVKAHNGDFFNDKADMLVKEALNLPPIEINQQETGPIISPPAWNNIPIDISIREFVKELNKKSINYQWTNQDRNKKFFSKEITNEESYEWSFLWNKQRKKRQSTSINSSKRKAFWIKSTQNELPTLDNLAIRKPKLYREHQTCPLCLTEKETRKHLFCCRATQGKLKDIGQK